MNKTRLLYGTLAASRSIMKQSLLLLGCLITAVSAQAINYNGHQYELVQGTWTEAEAAAVALGGHLVTINDAAEEAFLQTAFGARHLWIGMTDQAVEGTWEWISGEAVGYTNWAPSEPNDFATGEDYAVMNWSGVRWNDLSITGPTLGIAEIVPQGVPDGGATASLLGLGLLALSSFRRKH